MIFAIIYIVLGIITAVAIIYHILREQDLLRVEDILISLICGVFWWLAILCAICGWVGKHLNSRAVVYRRKK